MKKNSVFNLFKEYKSDIPASVIVFLVALPLCLGIALASGAPLFSGIIAGIVGGIIVASFSGSPLGVSGPAAGLAVIVLTAIQELGHFDIFLLAVVMAGFIQLALGFLKAGVIGYYFPSSVIKGMLSGIGILIILKQIPHAFGYDKDPTGDFSFIQTDGYNTFSQLGVMIDRLSPGAIIIAVISMAILILWEQPFIKKFTFSKIFQGPLVTVMTGIALNLIFINSDIFALRPDQVVSLPVADSLSGFFSFFTFPDYSQIFNMQVITVAFTIAIVASLETLLCVEATDKLDPSKGVTPTNRELKAQGIGNIVSGMIGGLPITQVIVRSSANIQSGGKSKLSAILHGILLLISAMSIPFILNLIPLASLAAILIIVGFKLTKPVVFKEEFHLGKSHFVPFIVTIAGIVFLDLLRGMGLGLVVALFYILWKNYRTPYHFSDSDIEGGKAIRIRLAEDVSFLNKASILNTLSHIPENCNVIIDASKTKSMHHDVIEIIEDFRENAKTKNIHLEFDGFVEEPVKDPVKQLGHLILKSNINNTKD